MVLEAPPEHELVNQEPLVILAAEADQLHQVRMPQLAEKVYLRLQEQEGLRSQPMRIKTVSRCSHDLWQWNGMAGDWA